MPSERSERHDLHLDLGRVRVLHAQGLSTGTIAQRLGRKTWTISRAIRKLQTPPPREVKP